MEVWAQITCLNCGRSGHWAKDRWRHGGVPHDRSKSGFHKGRGKGKVKGKNLGNPMDFCADEQHFLARVNLRTRHRSLCLFLHRLQPTCDGCCLVQFWRAAPEGPDSWLLTLEATCHSLNSGLRPPGAEHMHPDSGAQIHACPIEKPGQTVSLTDPGIHTASGARLKTRRRTSG